MRIENTKLWGLAFDPVMAKGRDKFKSQRQRLMLALTRLREKAALLAEEIPRDVAQLTDHSVRHLDALWQMADIITGQSVSLNPAEAFVFGSAVLLHDLGNAVAAYPNGIKDLYGPQWDDLVHAAYLATYNRRPTLEECRQPHRELLPDILLKRLRTAHAEQAEKLATGGFFRADGSSERVYLIDDDDLRAEFGPLIGLIARSHHFSVPEVLTELVDVHRASSVLPQDWKVDALKIACVLRIADAMHLDSSRATPLVRAFRRPAGYSAQHWEFQENLLPPTARGEQLVFESRKPFAATMRDAWWLCYETLQMVDAELHAVDAALRSARHYRLEVRSVAHMESPERLANKVRTEGWTPIDVRVQISDVASVIERFGGRQLYGDNALAPVRELISNAADAIRARAALTGSSSHPSRISNISNTGRIVVTLGRNEIGPWLEIDDNGIGMSESVLKGPLLDFGTTYWRSSISQKEHPGLLSSSFEPTGRFGIGFFSIFMLGHVVRIVTRPYRGGEEDTHVLEVSMKTRSPPFIREPVPDDNAERMLDGGTRVRVYLDNEPWSKKGLLGREFSSADESARLDALSLLVGRVAPALDISIFCVVQGEGGVSRLVVKADDWKELPFEQLASRVAGVVDPPSTGLGVPLDIRSGRRVLGRIRLADGRSSAPGEFVVRGVSALNPQQSFQGLMFAEDPDLSRSRARPIATANDLRAAADGVVEHFCLNDREWSVRLYLARFLLLVGLRPPAALEAFVLRGQCVSISAVESWLKGVEPGRSIRIVLPEKIVFKTKDGVSSVKFDSILSEWQQPDDVVIAGGSDSGGVMVSTRDIVPGYLPPLPERHLGFVTWNGERVPCSLAVWVVELAAKCWGVEPEKLLSISRAARSEVGLLRNEVPITVESLVVTRPRGQR